VADASHDSVPLRLVEHTIATAEAFVADMNGSTTAANNSSSSSSGSSSNSNNAGSGGGSSSSGRGLLGVRLGGSSKTKPGGNLPSINPEDMKLGALVDVSRAQIISIAKLVETQWVDLVDKL
jgi:hypothetical protein